MTTFKWQSTPLEEFIFYSRQSKTIDELCQLYEKTLNHYGFDRLAYTLINDYSAVTQDEHIDIVHSANLDHWISQYMEENYYADDITSNLIKQQSGVFEWEKIIKSKELSKKQKLIFQEAEALENFRGTTFSIHGNDGLRGAATVSSSQKGITFDPYAMDMINLISYQFHLCLTSIKRKNAEDPPIEFSAKEQEILKWVAQGLTKSDIGEKLHLSSHTIGYHTRNILKKSNTKNITEALTVAITGKLFDL